MTTATQKPAATAKYVPVNQLPVAMPEAQASDNKETKLYKLIVKLDAFLGRKLF